VHVEGWALDPAREASAISLRYGHQDLPCDSGAARTDTPLLYPDSPHAARAGFRSRTILAAGRGPLRVRARFADGTAAVAPTGLRVEIETDENHPPGLGLDAARVPLPGYERRPPAPAARAARPLNLLFVLHGDFTANSSLQACALANELADAGHDCVLAVPRDRGTLRHQDAPRFRACLHAEAAATGGAFADGRGPDFVHAWTTRECIREVATEIRRRHGGGLVVHLEDNEQALLAHALGRPWEELAALPDVELDALVPADLAHPRRAAAFLAAADGVTVIVDRLREFVPAGKPCATVWPAADARYFFPRPKPAAFRRLLEGRADETVLFYHGNVHAANAAEMRELYAAIAALDADGVPVRLIRAGVDQVAFMDADLARRVAPRVLNLGQILNHRHLPPLMALADLFVQPGAPDAFNDYRFPSKLPEFFALGRPVVLPRSNLGESLRHGEDAWVLPRADAAGIAAAIRELRARPDLADRLARGAAEFARRHLDWRRSAATLANFYAGLTRS
jgi:glycosyltransferase involved in cell wall biosynthesis